MPNDMSSFETFWNPGPSPGSPWDQLGNSVAYDTGGVLVPSTVTGGDKGAGTINAQGIYLAGVPLGTPSGVTAGTYGDSTHVGQFTVNALGIITVASSVSISASAIGAVTSVTAGTGISVTGTANDPIVGVNTTYLNTNYLQTAGGTMSGPIATANFTSALKETIFGFGSTPWKIVQIGMPGTNHSVALSVDPTTITGGSFSGTGQVLFGTGSALAPNSGGTDWQGLFRATGGFVYVGAALNSGEIDTTKALRVDTGGSILAPGNVTAGGNFVSTNYAQLGGVKLWNGTTTYSSIVETGTANQARLMDGAAAVASITLDWSTAGLLKIRNAAGTGDGNMSAANGTFSGTVAGVLGQFTAPSAGTQAGTFIGTLRQRNITDGTDGISLANAAGSPRGTVFVDATRLNIDSPIGTGISFLPNATAPAGGSNASTIFMGSISTPDYIAMTFGTGAPTFNSPQGSMYYPRDGAAPWFKSGSLVGSWVQLATGTGATAFVGTSPPASPIVNQLWWKSDDGIMYLYYNDGNSTQWVPAAPAAVAKPANALQVSAAAGSFATTISKIVMTAPTVNQNGTWDAVNNRWTPPAGTYHITGAAYKDLTGSAIGMTCAIYKNGSPLALSGNTAYTSNVPVSAVATAVVAANGTDYFELWASTGAVQTIVVTGTYLNAIGL